MNERIFSSMFLSTFGVMALAGCAGNSTEDGDNPAESEVSDDAVTGEKAYNPGAGWSLKWQDDFEGTSLKDANWNVLTSNWDPVTNNCNFGTGELEFPRAANVVVGGGSLTINAERASGSPTDAAHCPGQGRSFFSGRITTRGKVEKMYGKIVASIRMPTGFGMWPAFWTLGANIAQAGWPSSGEIDIMEWDSRAPSWMKSATHWKGGDWGTGADRGSTLSGSFHTYEVEWNANQMIFRLDGNVVANQNFPAGGDAGKNAAFHHPHYIILNLAVGGNWYGNPAPSAIDLPAGTTRSMQVQWLRWYQK